MGESESKQSPLWVPNDCSLRTDSTYSTDHNLKESFPLESSPPKSSAYAENLSNVDIESLVLQMSSSNLEEVSEIELLRYVPKGFPLQAAFTNAEYENALKLAKGSLPLSSGFQATESSIGFCPVELMESYAIHRQKGASLKTSSLTNDIHPLFASDRFDECPEEIYLVLTPALRLASMFLTNPKASSYWLAMYHGEREICKDTSTKAGFEAHRIHNDIPYTSERFAEWEQWLLDAVKYVTIGFDSIDPSSRIYGVMWWPCAESRQSLPLDPVYYRTGRIDLHTDFYTTAKRLSILGANADPDMILRFHFFFAVNIVHEVAHFVERLTTWPNPEVFMFNNVYNEVGASWEVKTFGGRIHPINNRMDCAYGIATYDWKDGTDEDPITHYAISMDYITMIQQRKSWETDHVGLDWHFWHVPRTGATSVGSIGLGTQLWDDELVARRLTAQAKRDLQNEKRVRQALGSIMGKRMKKAINKSPNSKTALKKDSLVPLHSKVAYISSHRINRATKSKVTKRLTKSKQLNKQKATLSANWLKLIEEEKVRLMKHSEVFDRRRSI